MCNANRCDTGTAMTIALHIRECGLIVIAANKLYSR
jgi:hypothetical protein